jgi:hypothetical protein
MKLVYSSDSDFPALLHELERKATHLPALYGQLNLKFYEEYYQHKFLDRSVLFSLNDAPIAGMRVTSHLDDGGTTLFTCYGLPTIFIEKPFASLAEKARVWSALKDYIYQLVSDNSNWRWEHMDRLDSNNFSEMGRFMYTRGATPICVPVQVIDLTQSESDIFSCLTKNYRWCVNWGRKNMQINVIDHSNISKDEIGRFMHLHLRASGGTTRSSLTWDRQFDMIAGNEAFAVFGEISGELVSAALFPHSDTHCYYGVSASRRDLQTNSSSLSHALVWYGITNAKKIGCKKFETGEIKNTSQMPAPSEKELSISAFKRGFGGSLQVNISTILSSKDFTE